MDALTSQALERVTVPALVAAENSRHSSRFS